MKRLLSILTWPLRTFAAMLLQPDKVCHIYWGAAIGYSFGLWMGLWALSLVVVFAASKEVYDLLHPPHHCDLWDFAATLVGGACSIGVIFLHARFP